MASGRIQIAVGLETRGVAKGAKDAEKALENLEDAVGDTGTAGGKDLEKIEDELKDVQKQSKKTGDAVGKNLDSGTTKAKQGVADLGDEGKQTAAEVAASFDGSAESIAGGFQELAANAFSGLGPAGAAAGAAVAAGIGVITQAYTDAAEASDEARNSAYEYGLAVGAAGKYADAANRINELTGSVESLKKIQDLATISGWDQKDVLTALATGDGLPALAKAFDEGANSTSIASARALELQGVLDGTAQGLTLAAAGADVQAKALYDLATQVGATTGEVDDLGNAIVTMPDGKEIVVDAETKTAYEDLDAIEKKNLTPKTVPVTVKLDSAAWDNWNPKSKTAFVRAQTERLQWMAGRKGT